MLYLLGMATVYFNKGTKPWQHYLPERHLHHAGLCKPTHPTPTYPVSARTKAYACEKFINAMKLSVSEKATHAACKLVQVQRREDNYRSLWFPPLLKRLTTSQKGISTARISQRWVRVVHT